MFELIKGLLQSAIGNEIFIQCVLLESTWGVGEGSPLFAINICGYQL